MRMRHSLSVAKAPAVAFAVARAVFGFAMSFPKPETGCVRQPYIIAQLI
jgi:hypothetical protein